jgi:hypothetical protein
MNDEQFDEGDRGTFARNIILSFAVALIFTILMTHWQGNYKPGGGGAVKVIEGSSNKTMDVEKQNPGSDSGKYVQ